MSSEPLRPMPPLRGVQVPEPASSITPPRLHPERELPSAETTRNTRLHETAETIGAAVGNAVETAKQLPRRLQRELPRRLEDMKKRFTVITGRGKQGASATTTEWKETAQERLSQARNRAQYLADEYPLRVIAGAAVTAFIVGFALRVWRSNRG
jgi:hypothetical protein